MAIDAKQSFLNQVKEKCADKLTVVAMEEVLKNLGDVLEFFKIEETNRVEWKMDDDDLLSSFIAGLSVSGRRPNTLNHYTYMIGRFMKFVQVPTRSVNVYHIREYFASEKRRGLQDSSIEGMRQILSSYFGWLFREGLIEKNPMVNIDPIKKKKKKKDTYSEIDIDRLYRYCTTLRDRVIVHFLYSTGCRISEMTELNRDMVDTKSLECVVNGKGGKERTVYLDPVTGSLLEEYLKTRKDSDDALFVRMRGGRLSPGGVRYMLKELGKAAGVYHVHPHKFRRTLATTMARNGMQIENIAAILGHEKIDTTMEYVVLNKEDIKQSYRRYA